MVIPYFLFVAIMGALSLSPPWGAADAATFFDPAPAWGHVAAHKHKADHKTHHHHMKAGHKAHHAHK